MKVDMEAFAQEFCAKYRDGYEELVDSFQSLLGDFAAAVLAFAEGAIVDSVQRSYNVAPHFLFGVFYFDLFIDRFGRRQLMLASRLSVFLNHLDHSGDFATHTVSHLKQPFLVVIQFGLAHSRIPLVFLLPN